MEMPSNLNSVLLVDDSAATNNYNKRLIEWVGFAEKVQIVLNGKEAINYMNSISNDLYPELILLDINMPNMGGFEFLKNYEKLSGKSNTHVMLLTTSISDTDLIEVQKYNTITKCLSKPLTKDQLEEIWVENFSD